MQQPHALIVKEMIRLKGNNMVELDYPDLLLTIDRKEDIRRISKSVKLEEYVRGF